MTNIPTTPPPPPGPPGQPYYAPQAPPKKKTSKVLIGLLACGGLFILALIIGAFAGGGTKTTDSGSSGSTGGAAAPTTANTPTTKAAGTTKDNPAPVGTAVEAAKGWTVTVTGPATLDADAEMAAGNQFNKPGAGKQFVLVPVSITNKSDKPAAYGSNVKVNLLPPSGVAIDRSYMAVGVGGLLDPTSSMAQMQPGSTVAGKLLFQVPEADVDSVVLLAEPQMTLDENEDQRFLAIK